jgi:hypothetical protein
MKNFFFLKGSRSGYVAIAMVVSSLSVLLLGGSAYATGESSIQKICDWRWSTNDKAQQLCQESQSAAASELMRAIEHEVEGAAVFLFAKACIEKFRLLPPEGIDWVQALSCFRDRLGERE